MAIGDAHPDSTLAILAIGRDSSCHGARYPRQQDVGATGLPSRPCRLVESRKRDATPQSYAVDASCESTRSQSWREIMTRSSQIVDLT